MVGCWGYNVPTLRSSNSALPVKARAMIVSDRSIIQVLHTTFRTTTASATTTAVATSTTTIIAAASAITASTTTASATTTTNLVPLLV